MNYPGTRRGFGCAGRRGYYMLSGNTPVIHIYGTKASQISADIASL